MPGEHDASLDNGKAFKEFFGATHYTFDHKGVHFIVVDNVSDPGGDDRRRAARLARRRPREAAARTRASSCSRTGRCSTSIRSGTGRRATARKAIDAAACRTRNVTVFYGHIHQEHHHMTGHIAHHSAKSLIFPLPAPGSQPKRTPLPWDPAQPYKGLGFREVEAERAPAKYVITELPVQKASMHDASTKDLAGRGVALARWRAAWPDRPGRRRAAAPNR